MNLWLEIYFQENHILTIKLSNKLKSEKSPYLKQHENNPVDWLAWNKDSLKKAQVEKKPIFLSIGYASCHWCHVMAHESFENIEIAKVMNDNFINIKVDREERPDLDFIFQRSLGILTGCLLYTSDAADE